MNISSGYLPQLEHECSWLTGAPVHFTVLHVTYTRVNIHRSLDKNNLKYFQPSRNETKVLIKVNDAK